MQQWINYTFYRFLCTLVGTAKGLCWTRRNVPISRYLEPNSSSRLQLPSCWHSMHFRPSDCWVASHISTVSYSELTFHAPIQNTETCFGRSLNLWRSFFIIKPTTCTNFTNLFWHETLCISGSSPAHHQEFIHCNLTLVYVIQFWRQLSSRTRMPE